jgi:hypothetical protein
VTSRIAHFVESRLSDGGEVVNFTRWLAALNLQEESWYSFMLHGESTPEPYSGSKIRAVERAITHMESNLRPSSLKQSASVNYAAVFPISSQSQSQRKNCLTTDIQPVGMSWCQAHSGTCDQMLLPFRGLLSESCCLVSVGHPLWREVGSVICQSQSEVTCQYIHKYLHFVCLTQFRDVCTIHMKLLSVLARYSRLCPTNY